MHTTFARRATFLQALSLYHQPWPKSTSIAPSLSPSQLIEEEKTPYYSPERFYPVKLGEVLQDRYQIATKLGFGSGSTVWLARDLQRWRWQSKRYVAVKVTSNLNPGHRSSPCPELAMLKRISNGNAQHQGWHFVRKLIDSFSVSGVDRDHVCLVFEPLREPLWIYARRFIGGVIPSDVLKVMVQMMLHGLEYLHTECQVIHADLKPDNIMVKLESPSILERDAQDEHDNPLPQKHVDGRTIHLSRNDYGPFAVPTGIVQIVDFDRSVLGNRPQSGCIQADVYRAPEVILDVGYTYSADIWSFGVMLWDLMEGTKLFDIINPEDASDYDEYLQLAQMTALLGPRPQELRAGRRNSTFFDSDGALRKSNLIPEDFTFESSIRNIRGEEKAMFIRFVKRLIRWRPEERSTAKELLDDPWLYTDFAQD